MAYLGNGSIFKHVYLSNLDNFCIAGKLCCSGAALDLNEVLYPRGTVSLTVTDMSLTGDPGVSSLIPVRFHTFVEIDHEKNSSAILLLCANSKRVVLNYKLNHVHEVLVSHFLSSPRKKV